MDFKTFCMVFDVVMALVFLCLGFSFCASNGKGLKHLTGYKRRSGGERENGEERQICRSYGKIMMCWAIPFLIGLGIDIMYPGKGLFTAWMLWAVLYVYFLRVRYKVER